MLLRCAISPRPPLFPLSSASYSSSPSSPSSCYRRSAALHPLPDRRLRYPVLCCVSQVHSYETVDYKTRRPRTNGSSLYLRIATLGNPEIGLGEVLDGWEKEKRPLSKWELYRVAKELRKFHRHKLALEVFNWMIAQENRFNFTSSDMAVQLDLIANVYGISRAEEHFRNLPDALRDKCTYGALLNVYCQAKMKEKSEATFEIMKKEGYATDCLSFNVMMTLYMNIGEHEKVTTIIDEMKEKQVKLGLYTYNIWITNCAAKENIEEMELVAGLMKSDSSINANWTAYTTLATMYIRLGCFDKAESCLKEAEIKMTEKYRTPFHYLIGLYSNIGKREEVYRIWEWYKTSFPSIVNLGYHVMVSALTRLEDLDGAESIYEEWISSTSKFDPRICNILMGSYIREGLVGKAKDVLDHFLQKGGKPKSTSWELLAEGYIKEKKLSESVLCIRATGSCLGVDKWRPKPTIVANFLGLCNEQSDTGSARILIDILRQRGFHEKEEYKSLVDISSHDVELKEGL